MSYPVYNGPSAPSYPPLMQPQTYPPPPVYDEAAKKARLKNIAQRFEICDEFAQYLTQLEGKEIVCLFDDSGSMNAGVDEQSGDPFRTSQTRWSELKAKAGIIIDIASAFDPTGVDVYFLNRPPLRNIVCSEQLVNSPQFINPPSGGTPLAKVLKSILQEKVTEIKERTLVILIATDGLPTNDAGNTDVQGFKDVLNSRNPLSKIFVTIMACTDDENVIGYLNGWDKELTNLDVVDDYQSERKEIIKAQGSQFKFTLGDYVIKSLLGSFVPWFDSLDEKKVKSKTPKSSKSSKTKKNGGCILL